MGSCSKGFIQIKSSWSRKPLKMSPQVEDEGPITKLLQFRSPPIIVLERWFEEKFCFDQGEHCREVIVQGVAD